MRRRLRPAAPRARADRKSTRCPERAGEHAEGRHRAEPGQVRRERRSGDPRCPWPRRRSRRAVELASQAPGEPRSRSRPARSSTGRLLLERVSCRAPPRQFDRVAAFAEVSSAPGLQRDVAPGSPLRGCRCRGSGRHLESGRSSKKFAQRHGREHHPDADDEQERRREARPGARPEPEHEHRREMLNAFSRLAPQSEHVPVQNALCDSDPLDQQGEQQQEERNQQKEVEHRLLQQRVEARLLVYSRPAPTAKRRSEATVPRPQAEGTERSPEAAAHPRADERVPDAQQVGIEGGLDRRPRCPANRRPRAAAPRRRRPGRPPPGGRRRARDGSTRDGATAPPRRDPRRLPESGRTFPTRVGFHTRILSQGECEKSLAGSLARGPGLGAVLPAGATGSGIDVGIEELPDHPLRRPVLRRMRT